MVPLMLMSTFLDTLPSQVIRTRTLIRPRRMVVEKAIGKSDCSRQPIPTYVTSLLRAWLRGRFRGPRITSKYTSCVHSFVLTIGRQ